MSVRAAAAIAAGLIALPMVASGTPAARKARRPAPAELARAWPNPPNPPHRELRRAIAFAAARPGKVAFAVLDDGGRLRGFHQDELFSSASASKVLLLAAELRRLRASGEPLDEGTRELLTAMITYSDDRAADAIYARVGDPGLQAVAAAAGMRELVVDPGFWGGTQISAADMARFYARLERNLVGPHARFALDLLDRIVPEQRWGIPAAAGPRWRVWFKGGWRPAGEQGTSGPVTNQAGLLRNRDGERLALAVLTDEPPSSYGGYPTIEGITSRLLAVPPRAGVWPAG
jgi:beta-lactamase class A